ncbi:radical SAM/SPASM family putative metalloenzyme maturase [Fundidesulfovibrio soli]|uniref:radical SAM/SPASM family putative metalloenzyme maturase n=1 Tax=Fundidesulfovibrio soli TaxID=2922716 RepID=UPI001FAF5968|nr:radical SAM/SPASM family putative metalloenzyme maturase [Fundidesulfovibrio soli]
MPQAHSPSIVHVEPTTRCNMRCRMCVKAVTDSPTPDGDMPLEDFQRLLPDLASCDRLVFAGVGEPLLHRDLPAMIASARQVMSPDAQIAMQTNGLLLTKDLALELATAGLDTVCISLDSLSDADGETLHGAVRLQALADAYEALRLASERTGRPIRAGAQIVLMRENAPHLPAMVRWAGEHGARFVIVSHLFPYTREAEEHSLFNPNPEEAARYFSKWKAIAAGEGLDFDDYYKILWRVDKSEGDKRLVHLVKLMQRDANAHGVWMNVRSLFDWDSTDRGDLERAFEGASAVAREMGMEISLPPLSARQERRCGFMEEGATFISRSGQVAPCHFLWRNYRCVMGGETKHVRAAFFGSIRQARLEDIWNEAGYKDFRSQALAYEYPHCASCNGGPCSDVTSASSPFEEDCIGSRVPCCHCPWPVGQLACLS